MEPPASNEGEASTNIDGLDSIESSEIAPTPSNEDSGSLDEGAI